MRHLPNLLSVFRLLSAPVLLVLAWNRLEDWWLVLLLCSLVSDVADGFIARHLNATSELGAKLDSLGDMATYFTVPVCAWLLFPHLIIQERLFVLLVVLAYGAPVIASVLKFKQIMSYHTISAKVAGVLMGVSVLIAFTTNITWPFRLAVLVQLMVAVEYISITRKLQHPETNIKSWFHL